MLGSKAESTEHASEGVFIAVREILLSGPHGVYEAERRNRNRFSIDIEVEGAFGDAVISDSLEDTVDYTKIVALVREINESHQFQLIESFAGAIADALIARFSKIARARVRVAKLKPPHLPGVGSAEANVMRRRR